MSDETLNPCPPFSPFEPSLNVDPPPNNCDKDCEPTQNDPSPFLDDLLHQKKGLGVQDLCDPFQTGQISQDFSHQPSRNTIYRYSRSLRACDEAVMDLFRNVIVIDEQGTEHAVPIIMGTQERAVAAAVQQNVRKDESLVVDRVKLPIMSLFPSDFSFNANRYTYHRNLNYFTNREGRPAFLYQEDHRQDTMLGFARGIPIDKGYQLTVWTYYMEDMNQILEQLLLKFSPIAYIRLQGVPWETIVKLDSIANNLDTEPGDQALRVVKFQFNMTAETYIPQPIARRKPVKKVSVDLLDQLEEHKVTEIWRKVEISND